MKDGIRRHECRAGEEDLTHEQHELNVVTGVTYAVAATRGHQLRRQVGVTSAGKQRSQVFRREGVVFLLDEMRKQGEGFRV